MLTKEDKLKFCQRCDKNFYNGNNPMGIKECWFLKDNSLTTIWLKGMYFSLNDMGHTEVAKHSKVATRHGSGASIKKLQVGSEDLQALRDIRSGKLSDDANVGAKLGHRLHLLRRRKFINGELVEGSDAPVEALGLPHWGSWSSKELADDR